MPEQNQPAPDRRTQVVAAWAGVSLTVIAVLGLIAAPGVRFLWIVMLIFGIATIPQVLLWRHKEGGGGDPDDSDT
jgi:hypothetical protein